MPLPLTPTTGFGRKQADSPMFVATCAADQLIKLDLVRGRHHFAE